MQKQQPNRKVLLFLATLAVLAGIVWGALFLIAPIWQPGTPVAYMPALPQTEAAAESAPTQLVDLNTADAETLQTLPGIGPAKAAAIIAYREEHGPFAALQDVANVPGISRANDRKMGRPGTDGNARRKGTINREESPWKSPRASLSTVS